MSQNTSPDERNTGFPKPYRWREIVQKTRQQALRKTLEELARISADVKVEPVLERFGAKATGLSGDPMASPLC